MLPRRPLAWVSSLLLLLALGLSPAPARGDEPPARISVLTMGPGEHPFTRFGHNAILIEWPSGAPAADAVYNFGTFEFDGVRGVEDFLAGRFRYWLSVATLDVTLREYAKQGRSLVAQELELTLAERSELANALAENAGPERRYYDYDYYRDNCSTRVRDALDRLLRGELRRRVAAPGRLTFRQHTLRSVADTPWIYAGLDLALGAPTDHPTTRWQELFLPAELHDALGSAARERSGTLVPLVRDERQLLSTNRPPTPANPPERRPAFALLGLGLGSALALLGAGAASRRALRVAFGVVSALLGVLLGTLGCVFTGFWAFTKHFATHQNHNLLLCAPWALVLGFCGLTFALGRPGAAARLRRWLTLGVVSSLAALLLALLPSGGYEGLRMVALFLPLWTGWLLGAKLALAPPRAPAA
jgi:hypothetical protein